MNASALPPPAPAPMRADARRNRGRLMAAAMAAFSERASDDTSLEEIARRAGVGIGTLYRHFPTRQALLEAVYRDQVDSLCAEADRQRSAPDPGAALRSWLHAFIQFATTKRTLTAELVAGAGGKNAPLFSACSTALRESVNGLLGRAQEAGQVRPEVEVSDLLRLAHALVMASERDPEGTGRLLALMLDGLMLPGPATTPAGGSRTGC